MSDTLTKISKVLNQAENASTPEEAEAFFAAAQALASKYSIDLAVARAHTAKNEAREEPVRRTFRLEGAARNTKKHLVNLYHRIAEANDVRIDIAHGSETVYPYGFPSDIDVTDAIFASVSTHMVQEAEKYLKTGAYKAETERRTVRYKDYGAWGYYFDAKGSYDWDYKIVDKPIDGRTARGNFYMAYASQIGRRLSAETAKAREAALASDESTGTELALIEKATEVAAHYKRTSNARGSWGGPSVGGYSASANGAGKSAANSARLSGSAAVGGSKALPA